MTLSAVRQRNPNRPNKHHRRQALSVLDQIFDQGARSPRSRRASSIGSLNGPLEDITRLCNELEASRSARSQRRVPDLEILSPDVTMMDFPSPMPSESPSPTSPTSPLFSIPQPAPSRVKDGDMIRITLKIRTTSVPCIAKCCPREKTSAVDEDFVRTWSVAYHPTPMMRLETRGSEFWCSLDVVDVEKVGSTKRTLKLPIRKFSDRRFSVTLGVEALTSLGLIKNTGPRSSTPDPGHASVDNSLLLPGVWSRGFTPSSPTSPEPQRPPLNLTIPSVPEIRVNPPLLELPGGSTSADDSGSNSDMYSIVSFNEGARSPAPSEWAWSECYD
ncbi:hypothetical protein NW759_004505 [Fusarium solani]|uniref:Uncharacterized protein n=1 Tax=Fusarium solani TaxID=169388 RepID=A0A9P9RF79_FUSSL|nr:uncharacterized protein B0J15DRAFT_475936 [Fusarium solani]KAH7275815.1 hypothetical protein B0J15DRAFT_475936 [Fusarium solani]KAJ4227136.1 hypothetical protein NW759_004505 [Fusarium solani]